METICIENNISSSIGGGIRLRNESQIFTTYRGSDFSRLRQKNIERFEKEIIKLSQKQISGILNEENNIQIVSNYGRNNIPGLYQNVEKHPILTKTGCYQVLLNYESVKSYLPKFCIIEGKDLDKRNIVQVIKSKISSNFSIGEKVIIKHSLLDGNGSGTYVINVDENMEKNIEKSLNKFRLKLNDSDIFGVDYIIQEYIENKILEGSITFNIQNSCFDNWGLVKNCVIDGEYFASTNHFPGLETKKQKEIESKMSADFNDLLLDLRNSGVRGNIGFDLIISSLDEDIRIFVLESNGLHRTTGSTLPNNFAYNTRNPLFLGIPLHIRYLTDKYQGISESTLLSIEDIFRRQGTSMGQEQIINFKCDGLEYNYPVVWLGIAGNDFSNLVELIKEIGILNNIGKNYINNIITTLSN